MVTVSENVTSVILCDVPCSHARDVCKNKQAVYQCNSHIYANAKAYDTEGRSVRGVFYFVVETGLTCDILLTVVVCTWQTMIIET